MIRQRRQLEILIVIAAVVSASGWHDCQAQVVSGKAADELSEQFLQESGSLIFQEPNQNVDAKGVNPFSLSFDASDINCGQITAGQLWEYFHQHGRTSVERLKFDLNHSSDFQTDTNQLGLFRFQIEGVNGGMLSSLSLAPDNGSLEVPLDYDYMKRFSKDSQEIIRFQMPNDGPFSLSNTQILVVSDAPVMNSKNLIYLFVFCGFWIIVFIVLNRFTKPLDESSEEIKILSNPLHQNTEESVAIDSSPNSLPNQSNSVEAIPSAIQSHLEEQTGPVSNIAHRKSLDQPTGLSAGRYVSTR